LIHESGDLPSRRPSEGRASHSEADLRDGDNLVAVCGGCPKVRQTPNQLFKPASLVMNWMD